MKNNYIICCITLLFTLGGLQAQKQMSNQGRLHLVTSFGDQSVLLRWALDDKYIWQDGLKYGYRLIRRTIAVGEETLEVPRVRILADPLLPAPEEVWRSGMENPMTAVVAQAIFGEHFETTGGNGMQGYGKIIMEADELTQRYAFALYACDMDFSAAELSGLAFTDTTALNNETYVYEVSLAASSGTPLKGIALVGQHKKRDLPQPSTPVAIDLDSIIKLIWNYEELSRVYPAYDVERSADGQHFKRINTLPLTSLQGEPSGAIHFFDTPPGKGSYWYRVKGRDIFGNTGMPSETFRVSLLPSFEVTPELTSFKIESENKIVLEWKVGEGQEALIHAWELYSAPAPDTLFIKSTGNIPSLQRKRIQVQKIPVRYYRIRAIDVHGQYRESPTFMVQIPDTVPPVAPARLWADQNIDRHLQLRWSAVESGDLLGYDLYYAPSFYAGFSKVNKKPLQSTGYDLPLNKNFGASTARFIVRAVDERYNISPPSDTLSIELSPPPAVPVLTGYSHLPDSQGVKLRWSGHLPKAKAGFYLYRLELDSQMKGEWEVLKSISLKTDTAYTDAEVHPAKIYQYKIGSSAAPAKAVFSPEITVKIPAMESLPLEQGLGLVADRSARVIQVSWEMDKAGLNEIWVYRKTGVGKFTLYKTLARHSKSFTDHRVFPNNTYGYMVIGLYENGVRKGGGTGEIIF
ncbi:fibronectin type III domain-containing protein [Robertkochia flava]|uniref:hypothetical protein n=1 Tax=Robertkochia flava TaxID=3447986 RepID=UPI001CCC271D|nr:hypothetical protein [Robertkochia marina]